MGQDFSQLQASYSRVAEEYGDQFSDELANKPLDRELLDRLAAEVEKTGPICDMGCGPGQIARYLADCGVDAMGVDISQGMVAEARHRNPDIVFRQGNMMALDVEDGAWAGIAAFYSIIHIQRDKVADALRELKRVLRPEGLLLLSFHVGDEVVHTDQWWEKPVSLDFFFFTVGEMEGYLEAAGFKVEDTIERPPYEGVEHPSQRAYIFARKLGD